MFRGKARPSVKNTVVILCDYLCKKRLNRSISLLGCGIRKCEGSTSL